MAVSWQFNDKLRENGTNVRAAGIESACQGLPGTQGTGAFLILRSSYCGWLNARRIKRGRGQVRVPTVWTRLEYMRREKTANCEVPCLSTSPINFIYCVLGSLLLCV